MRRFVVPVGALVVGVVLGGTVVVGAVSASDPDPVTVCVNRWFGTVRVADSCRSVEHRLDLASHEDVAALVQRMDAADQAHTAQQAEIDALEAQLAQLAARIDSLPVPQDIPEREPNDSVSTANAFPLAPATFSGSVSNDSWIVVDDDYWVRTFPTAGTLTLDCPGAPVDSFGVSAHDRATLLCGPYQPSGSIAVSAGETLWLRVGVSAGVTHDYVLTATFTPSP